MRLVIFGRQGAGKGTQADALSAQFHAPHISTGDILRDAVASGTEIGLKAKAIMDSGQLVSDEVMLGVVAERLAQGDVREHGFLLDGFPRTIAQAEGLVGLSPIDVAINLDVPEPVVLERLSSRRVCEGCGRNYSVSVEPGDEPACEACGGRLVQRDDDKPEAIKRRLEAYRAETVPTIEWFDSKGLLVVVDGTGSPEDVTERLLVTIDERLAAERE